MSSQMTTIKQWTNKTASGTYRHAIYGCAGQRYHVREDGVRAEIAIATADGAMSERVATVGSRAEVGPAILAHASKGA